MLKNLKICLALSIALSSAACGVASNNAESSSLHAGPRSSQSEDLSSVQTAIKTVAANKKSSVERTKIQEAAHAFLEKNGMIKEGEEHKGLLLSQKWTVVRIVEHAEASVVLMNLQNSIKGEFVENDASGWQMIAMTLDSQGEPTFAKFEDAFKVPSSLKLAIENQPPRSDRLNSYYYMEATGSSALNAMKSIYAGQPILGFAADLPKKAAPKLEFDPTPGRTWSVANATYDLRRGLSVEIQDVFPELIDKDYAAAAQGSGFRVAPWAAASIRQVLIDGQWVDVLPVALATKRANNENNE